MKSAIYSEKEYRKKQKKSDLNINKYIFYSLFV